MHKRYLALACAQTPLVSRIVAAIFGGYVVAALNSVAALALPMNAPEAAFVGMLSSFLMFACVVIWVFAVRSARRAWAGVLMAVLLLLLVASPLWKGVSA